MQIGRHLSWKITPRYNPHIVKMDIFKIHISDVSFHHFILGSSFDIEASYMPNLAGQPALIAHIHNGSILPECMFKCIQIPS